MRAGRALGAIAAATAVLAGAGADATELGMVQMAALTQPQINLVVRLDVNGQPGAVLTYESEDWLTGASTIEHNIQAYFDTGASGLLLSNSTADALGLIRDTYLGQPIIHRDIGVAGADDFNVSTRLHIGLAPFYARESGGDFPIHWPSDPNLYTAMVGPVRTQIGPTRPPLGDDDDLISQLLAMYQDLDVIGTPAMTGRVVVMNPRPANIGSLDEILTNPDFDDMRTYVYDPGTPFHPLTQFTDPGIPATSRHIKLSQANFASFTELLPAGAPGPTLATNPFIGPDPVAQLQGNTTDTTPGVTVSYNGRRSTGSWLLDTGAAASMISTSKAAELGIELRYEERVEIDIFGEVTIVQYPVLFRDGVKLLDTDQFVLTIGGIGGQKKVAGFYLDDLLVRTMEGDADDDQDPAHLRYVYAPVLVNDITLKDPLTSQTLTLDGIFGMNFLSPSLYFQEDPGGWFPILDLFTFTRFDWLVYDHDAGVLGLELTARTWTGTQGQHWDLANERFTDGQFDWVFQAGDYVKFTDSGYPNVVIDQDVLPGSVEFDHTVDYTLSGQAIAGNSRLIKRGTGTLTVNNSNRYTGATDIHEGLVVLAAPQDIGPVTVFPDAQLRMQTRQRFRSLNLVGGTAALAPGGDNTLVLTGLTTSDGGTLDLADNSLIINVPVPGEAAAALDQIEAMIRQARGNAGDWQGAGLTSSAARDDATRLTALGAILNRKPDGQTPIYTQFAGETVDTNSILVKYTWYGDANLDGVVNADDYFQIDSGFVTQTGGWLNGDFNYDGVTNADDYFLIDSAFIGQRGPMSTANAAPVPEPAAGVALLLGLSLLGRRRYDRRPRG